MRAFLLALGLAAGAAMATAAPPFAARPSDDDAIPAPPATTIGDVANGRAIVTNRQHGLCLLCHSGPFPEDPFQGNLGPSLDGIGARLTSAELRLRLTDPRRLNPESIMPSYARAEGFVRPAPAFANRAILTLQEIEDVVAFLSTLR